MLKQITIVSFAVISISGHAQLIEKTGIEMSWDKNILLAPSRKTLASEKQNLRVIIYDGLQESDVNSALDNQFERIEHMMFIRTKSADGSMEDSEDCD